MVNLVDGDWDLYVVNYMDVDWTIIWYTMWIVWMDQYMVYYVDVHGEWGQYMVYYVDGDWNQCMVCGCGWDQYIIYSVDGEWVQYILYTLWMVNGSSIYSILCG